MRLRIIITLSLLSLLASCEKDDRNKNAVQAIIEEEVAQRIENYKQVRMERCYEKALEEASYLADSILIREARLKRDTLGKPPKPARPEKPEIKTVLDSTPIKPLLEGKKKNTPIDSLGKN